MADQSFWFLENIDVMGLFCPNKMADAPKHHATKEFKKGEYIYLPDDLADKIYIIVEGRVKIGSYNESGKEITKSIIGKGEMFGELAIAGEAKRRDFAYVMENVTTCLVSRDQMGNLMKEHNGLQLFLMRAMGSRVLEMEQRLESLVFKDSRSRIVEYLIDLVNKKGQRVGYEMLVRNFLTHQDIASLTATSRQTVTTVLNELRSKNILTFNRKRLLVRDLDLLSAEMK